MDSVIDMIKLQPFSLSKLYSEKHFSIVKDELDSKQTILTLNTL
jgi:hypothetical protein